MVKHSASVVDITSQPVSLALQGGGSHAAFSWGALDRLLADPKLRIEAVSATSAGAMLAVVMAQGMLDGGHDGARDALLRFWRKVNIAAGLLPIRTTISGKLLGHVGIDLSPTSLALDYLTKFLSPYQFNLFDINPLKSIVEEMVDFEALQYDSPFAIYINATHARTGKSRLFTHDELTLDAVMASCCLPYIVRTVEIDGEPYWDGSFSGCPALAPLVGVGRDIVLVQVHPAFVEDVPTGASDILDRMTEISFRAALLADMKAIEQYNGMIEAGTLKQRPIRLHCIEADELLLGLGRSSKLNAEWNFLMHLHDAGMQAASDWLDKRDAA
jgi:NTE family protein